MTHDHEKLMREAEATSRAARLATWRARATAAAIERELPRHVGLDADV
jgi:hypothetical protein